jgi:hypothetical protein
MLIAQDRQRFQRVWFFLSLNSRSRDEGGRPERARWGQAVYGSDPDLGKGAAVICKVPAAISQEKRFRSSGQLRCH